MAATWVKKEEKKVRKKEEREREGRGGREKLRSKESVGGATRV
jgi:hypothetical protein